MYYLTVFFTELPSSMESKWLMVVRPVALGLRMTKRNWIENGKKYRTSFRSASKQARMRDLMLKVQNTKAFVQSFVDYLVPIW